MGERKEMKRPNKNPSSTKLVVFYTKNEDGKEDIFHEGFFVKDINKHIRNVKRWKDDVTGIWYDDDQVTYWFYPKVEAFYHDNK